MLVSNKISSPYNVVVSIPLQDNDWVDPVVTVNENLNFVGVGVTVVDVVGVGV